MRPDRINPLQPDQRIDVDLAGAIVASGVAVFACTVPVAGQGHRPALVVSFAMPGGALLPPVVLLVNPTELAAFPPLVTSAVEHALQVGRSLS